MTRPERGGYLVFIVWSDVSSGALFCLALRAALRVSRFCFSLAANARSDAFIAMPRCSSAGREAIHALSASFVARCVLI